MIDTIVIIALRNYVPVRKYTITWGDLPLDIDSNHIYTVLIQAQSRFEITSRHYIMIVRGKTYVANSTGKDVFNIYDISGDNSEHEQSN